MSASATPSYILHIGHAKCGSSALQSALSRRPSLVGTDGTRYEYVAVVEGGRLLRGEELRENAVFSPWGYVCCLLSSKLAVLPHATLENVVRELSDIRQSGTVPMLSNEAWLTEGRTTHLPLLTGPISSVHAVVYVRPHVEWINSAWWQWGAWTSKPFDEWFDEALDLMRYEQAISAWRDNPHVERVIVRQLQENIVEDFGLAFGIADLPEGSANRGPGAPILRLFQRHPEILRPDPHASSIDFILERLMGSFGSGKPWVLDQARVKRILEIAEQDTAALRNFMDPDQAVLFDRDLRWSDPSAYSGFEASPPGRQPPSAEEMDALATEALRVIQCLDDENRYVRWERKRIAIERERLAGELQVALAPGKRIS